MERHASVLDVCGDTGKSRWAKARCARVAETEISRREPGNPTTTLCV